MKNIYRCITTTEIIVNGKTVPVIKNKMYSYEYFVAQPTLFRSETKSTGILVDTSDKITPTVEETIND